MLGHPSAWYWSVACMRIAYDGGRIKIRNILTLGPTGQALHRSLQALCVVTGEATQDNRSASRDRILSVSHMRRDQSVPCPLGTSENIARGRSHSECA